MEQVVTRDELVAYVDRVLCGAKRRIGSPTSLQEINGELIKLEVMMKFDTIGLTSFCGKRFVRR